jgi:hypothetical protein
LLLSFLHLSTSGRWKLSFTVHSTYKHSTVQLLDVMVLVVGSICRSPPPRGGPSRGGGGGPAPKELTMFVAGLAPTVREQVRQGECGVGGNGGGVVADCV